MSARTFHGSRSIDRSSFVTPPPLPLAKGPTNPSGVDFAFIGPVSFTGSWTSDKDQSGATALVQASPLRSRFVDPRPQHRHGALAAGRGHRRESEHQSSALGG